MIERNRQECRKDNRGNKEIAYSKRRKKGLSLYEKRLFLEVEKRVLISLDKQSRPKVDNFYVPCRTKQKMSEVPDARSVCLVFFHI